MTDRLTDGKAATQGAVATAVEVLLSTTKPLIARYSRELDDVAERWLRPTDEVAELVVAA